MFYSINAVVWSIPRIFCSAVSSFWPWVHQTLLGLYPFYSWEWAA